VKALVLIVILALIALGLEFWSRRGPGSSPMTHPYHAPHKGTIVRLGQAREEYHLELVHDPAAGKLIAYVLDHVAKEPIRAHSTSFELVVTDGAVKRTLTLSAVADPATGSTAADATRFEAQADWLKNLRRFEAELPYLKIGSTTFLRQPLSFPEGNERP
jgi:hypothetical protein